MSNPDAWLSKIRELLGDLPALARQLIRSYGSAPDQPLFLHLTNLVQNSGIPLDREQAFTLLRITDHYIRAKSRMDLLKAFWNVPVVIAGEGWSEIPLSPNHRWRQDVPLSKIGELMGRAKIVLCPNSGFVQRAHERILTAMGSGAVALTVPSTFLRDHFPMASISPTSMGFRRLLGLDNRFSMTLNGHWWEGQGVRSWPYNILGFNAGKTLYYYCSRKLQAVFFHK